MNYKELILYRDSDQELWSVFSGLAEIVDRKENGEDQGDLGHFFELFSEMIRVSDKYGLEGDLWKSFLALFFAKNVNAYSRACEVHGAVEGSINHLAIHDFAILKKYFDYDMQSIDEAFGSTTFTLVKYFRREEDTLAYNHRISEIIDAFARDLDEAKDVASFQGVITDFYENYGVGKLGLNKAFRIERQLDQSVGIVPIPNIQHIYLDDLVGYELQKKALVDNTEAFVEGRKANNCLLYGESGTGKSSSIKAILNQYYDRGLRIIEVYKYQFQDLNEVIDQIKDRNYKFIIYMDDLSFEEDETDYKYLKAIIEGDLGRKPENVLIYATSNRRHLIRENYSDKQDRSEDMHTSDTVQEKLSLYNRFGVTIFYGAPDKKEFDHIVLTLAERLNLPLSEEELLRRANIWVMRHGGYSGRSAEQFINYLLGDTSIGNL